MEFFLPTNSIEFKNVPEGRHGKNHSDWNGSNWQINPNWPLALTNAISDI